MDKKKLLLVNVENPLAQLPGFDDDNWHESGRLHFSEEDVLGRLAELAEESQDAVCARICYRDAAPPPDELLPALARLLKPEGHLVLHFSPAPTQKMCNALLRFMQAHWFPSIGMADDDADGLTTVACRVQLGREAMKTLLDRHTNRGGRSGAEDDELRQSLLGLAPRQS